MATNRTTHFLLGRRGRHLYPLRSTPTAAIGGGGDATGSPSPSSSLSTTILPTFYANPRSNHDSPTAVGRHGVPPSTKQRHWNCKKRGTTGLSPPSYAYPNAQAFYNYNNNHHSSSRYQWASSPIVLVTLVLLSACFVGAYCLVLRIDKTMTNEPVPQVTTPVTAASRVGTVVTLPPTTPAPAVHVMEEEEIMLVPLYLNLTVFQIPCEELTVQVLQQQPPVDTGTGSTSAGSASLSPDQEFANSAENTERLVFQAVVMEEEEEDTGSNGGEEPNDTPSSSRRITRGLQSLHNNNNATQIVPIRRRKLEQVEEEEENTGGGGDQQNSNDGHPKEEEEKAPDQQDENLEPEHNDHDVASSTTLSHHHHHHTTLQGCQIRGHLQLPLGNHYRPAIVSVKSLHAQHNLSHRVDLLKLGSKRHFPQGEAMVLRNFQPRTYTQLVDGDHPNVKVTHRYQVYNNFYLIEQQGSGDVDASSQEQGEAAMPEIQLVFSPSVR